MHTSDLATAKAFYGRLFGWEADELDLGEGDAGDGSAAIMWRRPGYGDHLAVTVDVSGAIDTAWTKAATMRDPQGAVFTLSQFTLAGGQ